MIIRDFDPAQDYEKLASLHNAVWPDYPVTVEELQSLTTALNEKGEGAAAAGGLPAETELGRLKQNMQDMVGRNPQSVAASLKSFMSGR